VSRAKLWSSSRPQNRALFHIGRSPFGNSWARDRRHDILNRMGVKRHSRAAARVLALPFALLLAMQSVSPCLALCSAAGTDTPRVVAEPAATHPACHAATSTQAQPAPAPSGAAAISMDAGSRCCCIADASARPQSEGPVAITRIGSVPSLELIASSALPTPRLHRASSGARMHGGHSPPGAPLFIAHHSLLI